MTQEDRNSKMRKTAQGPPSATSGGRSAGEAKFRKFTYQAPEPVAPGKQNSATHQDERQPLLLELAEGDITQTTSRIILLAQFQGLEPSEAWVALDHSMGGALSRLGKRKPPALIQGELDVVPTGRHRIMAEEIAFLGLGAMKDFKEDGSSLASATEGGLRGLLICQVEDFATVLLGANMAGTKGFDVGFSLRNMMTGFTRALRTELPEGRLFRRIVLVENNAVRMNLIQNALEKIIADGVVFEGFAVNLLRHHLPAATSPRSTSDPTNLLFLGTRVDGNPAIPPMLAVTLYPAQQHASVPRALTKPFDHSVLDLIYGMAGFAGPQASRGVDSVAILENISKAVSKLLPDEIRRHLNYKMNSGIRIDLVDDRDTAAVPWECLKLDSTNYPALTVGISRRFAGNRERIVAPPVTKDVLKILLVIDPTCDLKKAEEEGAALFKLLDKRNGIEMKLLKQKAATRDALIEILNAEEFHILHYAGHSGYHRDKADRFRSSGLLMHGGHYFTGADALGLKRFPPVVVFNSCEAARIDRLDPADPNSMQTSEDSAVGAVTIAEAFLKAGIQHFVGTFWPVKDEAAKIFSNKFYQKLAAKETIGKAMLAARQVLDSKGKPDWANYIHYGDPTNAPFAPDSE
jgi:hypothetical protein